MNKITFPLKMRMRGQKVADLQDALQLSLDQAILLANDEAARRELSAVLQRERARQTYGEATRKLVGRFQEEWRLPASGEVDEPTAAALSSLLEELEAFGSDAAYQVQGRVASRISASLGDLRVQVVDKSVRRDVVLAQATTDSHGNYRASFSDADLKRRGKEKPDLQARVFSGERLLAASEVRYDASTQETLNVLLDDKASTALRSEYETLTAALSVHYKGSVGDLQETDERQDVTYLANKSGWDARAVALAALAEQFSARTAASGGSAGIEPPFFYALFRSGLPANEAAIYRANPKTVENIWKQAVQQGVIPAALQDRLPTAAQQFQSVAAQRLLESPALVGASSFKELLTVSLGDDIQRQQFADLYSRHGHDPANFWKEVRGAFDEPTANRLQLDGQLAYITLNNAPLIKKLHAAAGENALRDTSQLVEAGFHRAATWRQTIGSDPVPPEIPGQDAAEKRERYAELLAAQVRLSFPTAVVAQMVKSGETPAGSADVRNRVHAFLTQHEGKFEIGMQPVAQYVARHDVQVDAAVTREITRIQRVYQVTPSDEAMNAVLTKGIDSAYAVVRYEQDEFVRAFKDIVGGEQNARLIHAKAQQVHAAVLNVAVTFLTARSAPGIGVHSPASIVDPMPSPPANAADVLAYATLENLFGQMDYCACEHCRSILSPAAYLVDLLLFIDRPDSEVPAGFTNPQTVLLDRRPDIQHLPLTCENTNTPLPYIDLVNETLEYYIANGLSLVGYDGHNTDGSVKPEDLLAGPQFVSEAAYTALAGENFPHPLPFHQPLENLRRYFGRFEVPLPEVMEALRKDDSLERASDADYGWRDIWMETLGLSRAEHRLLTERWFTGGATDVLLTVKRLYGFDPSVADADVQAVLHNAKSFCRRVEITYEQLAEILRTRFVNPNSHLIPRLERLGVPFATLKALKDGAISDAEFDALLAPGLDPAQYGGDIKAWVRNSDNHSRIMSLLTLTNPADPEDVCSFDVVELRYSNPDTSAHTLRPFEFVRLIRFIRLWKKLGWGIEQTDKAITALYPAALTPNDPSDALNVERLDAAFLTLLPGLGVVRRVMGLLEPAPRNDLLPLLACIAPIDTHGESSLYRQMLLSPSQLDDAFAEDGYGNYLSDAAEKLLDHAATLRAAFSLTASEFSQITATLGYDASTALTLDNISAVFRCGWLARKLKLSMREFLLLTRFTGYDPFEVPNPVNPAILGFIEFVGRLRTLGIKPVQALYLIWNQDLSGKSAPAETEVTGFARTLRAALAAVEGEFALLDDPDGSIARAQMALVYDNQATELFFGLLENTFVTAVKYSHGQATLEQPILNAAAGRITYDDFTKRLSIMGVLTSATRDALKAVAGVTQSFQDAVDSLHAENQKVTGPFFGRYPELLPLYEAFVFFGELKTTVSYSHTQEVLGEAVLDAAPGRTAYDHEHNEISFKGVLTATTRDALKAVAGVTVQFQAAVDHLFSANQAAIQNFFANHSTLAPQQRQKDAYLAANDAVERRRSVLLANFLPELKSRRKRQQSLQSVSAAAEADVGLASALLEDAAVLHTAGDASRPALDDLTALETGGLAAQYFYAVTAAASPDLIHNAEANLEYSASGTNKLPPNTTTPGGAISGVWGGYLEAPENGFYNVRIDTDATAAVTLTLSGAAVVLAQSDGAWRNTAPIKLRAGTLYAVSLKVENVKDNLAVRWQTTGRGWEIIPARYLYSATLVNNLRQAYTRFLKAAALAAALKLTAAEITHFSADGDYQVGGEGWLNHLPVRGSPDSATAAALLKAFAALLDFGRIKAGVSPGDERLLEVFQDPAAATADAESLLYVLTRWEKDSFDALLARFGQAAADLAHAETLRRIYDAYGVVKELGIPAAALIRATSNEPTASMVRELQAALRARYDESSWLDVLRPINDEMRSLQRDALVAYILHRMRSNTASAHVDTPEKLFEYFLMDVQMDPCMLTSRIRHALSSVQLFIERCLMNLEPTRVSPRSIKAKQWEWMKRYRVWEANRKVFLYPENWLEPELRDDQSPFFREVMSELLQGDITEDRAAEALLGYLTKLEEVAKLEICGIHYEETNDIAHVVARTAGANRKYFYRRREYGYWTPWEKVSLDIDDNPVLPVVWKNRLFLFWLKLVQETRQNPPPETTAKKLADVKPEQVFPNVAPKLVVKAILNWSEFLGGKWQPARTSDPAKPLSLGTFDLSGSNAFDRSKLRLSVLSCENGGLRLIVSDQIGTGSSFFLYNTFSTPELQQVKRGPHFSPPELHKKEAHFSPQQSLDTTTKSLKVTYSGTGASHAVLNNDIAHRTVAPHHPLGGSPWDAPFFYEDSRHAFYVTTEERLVKVRQWNDFGIVVKTPQPRCEIPPLVFRPDKGIAELAVLGIRQPGFGVIDPSPVGDYITEDAYIRTVIGTPGTVAYGDRNIGPSGSQIRTPRVR